MSTTGKIRKLADTLFIATMDEPMDIAFPAVLMVCAGWIAMLPDPKGGHELFVRQLGELVAAIERNPKAHPFLHLAEKL